jgi:hypothetical protein
MVFLICERCIEVQQSQHNWNSQTVRASNAVGSSHCENEVVILARVTYLDKDVLWVKKELKQSTPDK